MADVRLTATNPEDSSVVPVACNAKGELLLEEPTLASDDYVAKTGDNMTGNLTLGTDKITLDATAGIAEFAGRVEATSAILRGDASSEYTLINGSSETRLLFRVGFESPGDEFGFKWLQRNGANTLFNYSKLNCDPDKGWKFYARGSTDFDGSESPVITLGRNGSATFAGDVIVGSRSKQWMLVEQGGLCHMVQQARSTTADLVNPATEYPPLRDVIAELNVIEAALAEVMEKLRMKPPAGWEVWDGSSENS